MKKILKEIFTIAILFVLIVTNTFSVEVNAATKGVKRVSITNVKAKSIKMNVGSKKTLKIKVATTKKKVSKGFTVKSSNKKVVKAVKSGSKVKLTALKKGSSTITIISKANKTKKCTLKVTAVTPVIAVKGISLNKTSATAYAGTKINLTATITPSTATNKNVVWESSNNNLATVSNGVVALKAAGTVTITAKSASNTKLIAKCNITIKAPNNIKSMEYVDENVVKIELAKAQELSADNFKAMVKSSVRVSYLNTADIADITTTDNKIYTVFFKNEDLLGNYVKVSISGLEGVSGLVNKEFRMMPKSSYVYEYTGNYVSEYGSYTSITAIGLHNLFGNYILTDSSDSDVFELRMYTGYINIVKRSNVLGIHKYVINFKDEYGHIERCKFMNIVYDAEHMYGNANDIYGTLEGASEYSLSNTISAYGGSGSYKYEIDGETYGCSVSSGGYVSGKFSTPGDYKIKVKVTDSSNSSIYTYVDFTLHLKQGVLVSGVLTDALGQAFNGYIRAVDDSGTNKYMSSTSDNPESDGKFDFYVVPGTYTFKVDTYDNDYIYYFYDVIVTEEGLEFNKKLPVYKVTPQIDSAKYTSVSYWYDENNYDIGYNKIIYLKKGSYTVKAKATRVSDSAQVTLMAKINVTGEMTFTPTEIPYEAR